MSYANGINGLQQSIDSTAAQELKSSSRVNQAADAANHSSAAGIEQTQPDETHLSATGTIVSQALDQSDVRTEKIAALQQAIADGSYNVSASDVADKIVESLLK